MGLPAFSDAQFDAENPAPSSSSPSGSEGTASSSLSRDKSPYKVNNSGSLTPSLFARLKGSLRSHKSKQLDFLKDSNGTFCLQ
jgi:hypothetical protein